MPKLSQSQYPSLKAEESRGTRITGETPLFRQEMRIGAEAAELTLLDHQAAGVIVRESSKPIDRALTPGAIDAGLAGPSRTAQVARNLKHRTK
jgi:hypothetical protein